MTLSSSGRPVRGLAPRWQSPFRYSLVRTLGLGGLLVCVSAMLLGLRSAESILPYEQSIYRTVPVLEGEFARTITETGAIRSRSNVTLINHCEWPTTILKIVPEGTIVSAGDVIAELDSSKLREFAQEREIRIIAAESRLKQAQEAVELQKLNNESQLSSAELAAKLAALDLEAWQAGKAPQQSSDLSSAIALAEETFTRATKSLEFVKRMAAKGYRSAADVEGERLSLMKARQQLTQAQGALDLFQKHTAPRTLIALTGANQTQTAAVEHRRRLGSLAMRTREMGVRSAELSLNANRDILHTIQRNIAACTITAPQAGEVVYAERRSSRTGLIEEGVAVGFREPIAQLPDRSEIQVVVNVHESMFQMVSTGQQATISVEALPNLPLTGVVQSVNPQPRSGSYPYYDLRVHEVIVGIQGDTETLRQVAPGLSAKVDIRTLHDAKATYVPIETVVEVAGSHYTFVVNRGEIESRQVEIGEFNDHCITIRSGLTSGERVIASPRVDCAARLVELEDQQLALSDHNGQQEIVTAWSDQ